MAPKPAYVFPRRTPTNPRGIFYVTIPPLEGLTPEEREVVESGGQYPVHVAEYLPQHESFLDYLIDASFDDWSRAAGGGR